MPRSEWEYGHIWYLWHRRRLKIRCWCINYDYMCTFLWLGSLAFPALQIRPCSNVCMFKQDYSFHFRLDFLQMQLSMLFRLFHCFPFGLRKEKLSTSLGSKPRHKCLFHSHFPSGELIKSMQILFNAGNKAKYGKLITRCQWGWDTGCKERSQIWDCKRLNCVLLWYLSSVAGYNILAAINRDVSRSRQRIVAN